LYLLTIIVEFIELKQKVHYNIDSYLQGEIYIIGS